jgi:hypothetical protein
MMHHTPPKEIFDLFCDEYTAMTQGRSAFIDWVKSAAIVPGDTFTLPDVGGNHAVWSKQDFGVQEIN